MKQYFFVLCLLQAYCDASVDLEKRAYKPDPYPEGGTDPLVHDLKPVVINSRKFRSLVNHNDAVATCRYILFKAKKTFYGAKDHCESIEWPFTHRGIGMATIHSEEENHDITQLLKEAYGLKRVGGPYKRENWVWIGLSKRVNNTAALPKKRKGKFFPDEWYWTNGLKANYSKMAYKMPDQQYNNKYKEYQTWMQLNKRGHWDDTYASIEAPFACEYCGRYIVFERRLTWVNARDRCHDLGLKMAMIDSKEDSREFSWAVNITFGTQALEEKRFDPMNWIWIGSHELMDPVTGLGTGEWVHYDNTTIHWSPVWDRKRQPDDWVSERFGEQNVAAYSRIDSKWDDSFSQGRKRPFACMCPHTCRFPYDEYKTKENNKGRESLPQHIRYDDIQGGK